ncbi:MAG: hypothetical protein JWM82_440, partial [Myxococcales bacterium]|nr:hypothetical protein [Myxococcales bacterium]
GLLSAGSEELAVDSTAVEVQGGGLPFE